MGEYIKYKGKDVKIGTLENMYYVSFQKYEKALKEGLLSRMFDGFPSDYVKPDAGFRFRFPFPDEDKLPFGAIGNFQFDRGIPVNIDSPALDNGSSAAGEAEIYTAPINIYQQKLVHRQEDGKLCLVLVARDPQSGELFRIEEDKALEMIISGIMTNHIAKEQDPEKKQFYQTLAARIQEGYHLETPAQKLKNDHHWQKQPSKGKGKKL